MRTRCGSALTVLALVALLAPVAGCVDLDGFYSPGQLSGVIEPSGGTPACQSEVNAPSPAGSPVARSATARPAASDGRVDTAVDDSAKPAGFTTAGCEMASD